MLGAPSTAEMVSVTSVMALPKLLGDSLHAKDASWSIVKTSASSQEKYLEYVLLCLVSH